jgi:hypothetical protein
MTSLILHIGKPRTATTSVQQSLYRSRGFLRRQGVLYPTTGLTNGAHHRIGWGVLIGWGIRRRSIETWGDVPLFDELLKRLAAEVRASGCEHVIMSTEVLDHVLNVADAVAVRHRLIQLLALFSKVKVVCCVRHQVPWMESFYRFHVGWDVSELKVAFPDYVERQGKLPGSNYANTSNFFRDLRPDLDFQFWSFSEAVASCGVLRRFYQVAGIDQLYRGECQLNESLSREAVLAILEWNRAGLGHGRSRKSFVAWARAAFPENRNSLYDATLCDHVFDRYQESNALLEKQAGIRLLDTPERSSFATRCAGDMLHPNDLSRVHARMRTGDALSWLG